MGESARQESGAQVLPAHRGRTATAEQAAVELGRPRARDRQRHESSAAELSVLRRVIARLTRRGAPTDDEIARELRDHLELDAESLSSSGATADARFITRRR